VIIEPKPRYFAKIQTSPELYGSGISFIYKEFAATLNHMWFETPLDTNTFIVSTTIIALSYPIIENIALAPETKLLRTILNFPYIVLKNVILFEPNSPTIVKSLD